MAHGLNLAVMRWQTSTEPAAAELSFVDDNTSVTTSNLLPDEVSIHMSPNQTREQQATTEQNLIEDPNFEPVSLQDAENFLRRHIAGRSVQIEFAIHHALTACVAAAVGCDPLIDPRRV